MMGTFSPEDIFRTDGDGCVGEQSGCSEFHCGFAQPGDGELQAA